MLGASVVADEVEDEIERRLHSELTLVASSDDGWSRLLICSSTGDCWELTHPNSSWHGGGSKNLAKIAKEIAKSKYSV